jgi:hypothetical protein
MKHFSNFALFFLFLLSACGISSEQAFYQDGEKMDKSFDYTGTWEAFEEEIKDGGQKSEYIEINSNENGYEIKVASMSATNDELEIKFYPFYLDKHCLADVAVKKLGSNEDAKHLIVKLEKVNDKRVNVYELQFKNDPSKDLASLQYEKMGLNILTYHLSSSQKEVSDWLKLKIKKDLKFKKVFYLERK